MSFLRGPSPDSEEQISSLFMQHLRLGARSVQRGLGEEEAGRIEGQMQRISRRLHDMGSGV